MMKWIVCTGVLLLAGCTSERVILLPSADGHQSALVVKHQGSEQRLDSPYAALAQEPAGVQTYRASEEHVQKRFGQALEARPVRAKSFLVYFDVGSENLSGDAQTQIEGVKAELKAHGAPEIAVIGHTDRVGSVESNDQLSLKRAERVREILIAAGIDGKIIEVAGRGEREPLVPTEDEVAEARNRRVEINVR